MDEHDEYWEQQERLPLRKRDRLWWAEVAFSRAVITLAVLALVVIAVLAVIR